MTPTNRQGPDDDDSGPARTALGSDYILSPWHEFTRAMPADIADTLTRTATAEAALRQALARQWFVADLARFCMGGVGPSTINPAAVVVMRLREAAVRDPQFATDTGKRKITRHRLPWCGRCSDPFTRWDDTQSLAVRCSCWSPVLVPA